MRRRRGLPLAGIAVAAITAVAVLAAGLVLFVHQGHDGDDSDRGALTPHQYALALKLARSEITADDATVSTAVAAVGRAHNRSCSGQQLQVYLVGTFPHLNLGGPGTNGPDIWMVLLADPATGVLCITGPSTGHFHAPAGSANLLPAL